MIRPYRRIRRACLVVAVGAVSSVACDRPQSEAAQPPVDQQAVARAEVQRRAVAKIKLDLDEAAQLERSLEEAFRQGRNRDIARHGEQLVLLVREIRDQLVDVPASDLEILRLLVDRTEHAAHEMQEAAEARRHDDSHHAFETFQTELRSLRERVNRM